MRQQTSIYVLFLLLASCVVFEACSWKDIPMPKGVADAFGISQQEEIEEIAIQRYDILESRYLLTKDYSALQQMQSTYPVQTRLLIENFLKLGEISHSGIYNKLYEYYQDTLLQRVIKDVDTKYGNMEQEQRKLNKAFAHLKTVIPTLNQPVVYTQVGDFGESIAISGNTIGISLDKYLGADYQPYTKFFDAAQMKEMTREYIVPDCLTFFLLSKYPLRNFAKATQSERDHHIQCIWWLVNDALGYDFYKNITVSRGEAMLLLKVTKPQNL